MTAHIHVPNFVTLLRNDKDLNKMYERSAKVDLTFIFKNQWGPFNYTDKTKWGYLDYHQTIEAFDFLKELDFFCVENKVPFKVKLIFQDKQEKISMVWEREVPKSCVIL